MKKIHYLLSFFILLVSCTKEKTQLEEPTYSKIKIKIVGTQFYHASLSGMMIGDSLSSARPLDRFVPAQNSQRLVIKNVTTEAVIADTLIDLPHNTPPEFVVLEIDAQTKPLLLSASDLLTTAPTSDSLKFNFLNMDEAATKDKMIDLAFYQYASSTYTLKGQLKNIPYRQFSTYVTLPSNISTFFFEIKDSETGQVLLTKESRTGRLNRPGTYQANNVFSMLFKANAAGTSYTPSVLIQQRIQ